MTFCRAVELRTSQCWTVKAHKTDKYRRNWVSHLNGMTDEKIVVWGRRKFDCVYRELRKNDSFSFGFLSCILDYFIQWAYWKLNFRDNISAELLKTFWTETRFVSDSDMSPCNRKSWFRWDRQNFNPSWDSSLFPLWVCYTWQFGAIMRSEWQGLSTTSLHFHCCTNPSRIAVW